MKFYMLAINDNGDFADIRIMNNDECIMPTSRVKELKAIETRYKESLNSLTTHTLVHDDRLSELHKTEVAYKELIGQIGLDTFKPHYKSDPIKYAVHILKEYLRAYLDKHTTKCTGIVEKRMLVVSFCHRIEEGLIDYLDELEEFNS